MFPLTFEEFCLACGTPRSLIELVKQAIVSREAVPDFIHQKLIELHARYLLVGGLPEPVQRFLDTNDLVALRRAHKGVFNLYEFDIARHMSDNEGARFTRAVFEAIPGQLNKKNKRFKYSNLRKNGTMHKGDLRFSRLESSFDWFGRLASRCPRCAWASRAFPYPSMRTARPSSST